MASCTECVHVEVCKDYINAVLGDVDESQMCGDDCEFYKDRSRFVELPCKIGAELFRIKQINGKAFVTNTTLNANTFWNIVIQGEFGKTVFLTREEALKERENSV